MRVGWRSLGQVLVPWTLLLFPLVILGSMLLWNPTLRSLATWDRIARRNAGVAVLAIGLTPIIITGGIDLSVGSVVGLAAVVCGLLWRAHGWPIGMALAGGALAGLACGSVNGALVLAGINPLVVTLATLGVFRGLAYGLSGSEPVYDFPPALQEWWENSLLGLPPPLWIVLICFALGCVIVHHTWMGRMFYAIGDNRLAAVYAGVPVRTLTFSLYAASGLLAGLVGMASVCEFGSAPADRGENLELTAVACVVLGGVRITGGAGQVAGTLLGTITLAGLLEGMVRVRAQWRPLTTGVFLIIVVLLNEALARWRERNQR